MVTFKKIFSKIFRKDNPILLIDMDDVTANFTSAKLSALEKVPSQRIPWAQYKFFENLDPVEGAVETIIELSEHFDICFLTRPSVLNPLCYTEKRVWIEKYFGLEFCYRLILCYDKTMVKGDYLVDDYDQPGRFADEKQGLKPEWKMIKFGSDKFPDWKTVKEYLLKKI